MKRNVITITYFVDPKHKRHVEIPVKRVGSMLILGVILVAWSIVSAVKMLMPGLAPMLGRMTHEIMPAPQLPSVSPSTMIQAAAINMTVIPPEDLPSEDDADLSVVASSGQLAANSDRASNLDVIETIQQTASKPTDGRDEATGSSQAAGMASKVENLEPIIVDPLTPPQLPQEATEIPKPETRSSIAQPTPTSSTAIGVRLGEIRFARERAELRAEIPLINARADGQAIMGVVSGRAIYRGRDGEPLTISARREMKFSARHQTTKILLFPNPPQGGRFQRVELQIRDAASGAAASFERTIQ